MAVTELYESVDLPAAENGPSTAGDAWDESASA